MIRNAGFLPVPLPSHAPCYTIRLCRSSRVSKALVFHHSHQRMPLILESDVMIMPSSSTHACAPELCSIKFPFRKVGYQRKWLGVQRDVSFNSESPARRRAGTVIKKLNKKPQDVFVALLRRHLTTVTHLSNCFATTLTKNASDAKQSSQVTYSRHPPVGPSRWAPHTIQSFPHAFFACTIRIPPLWVYRCIEQVRRSLATSSASNCGLPPCCVLVSNCPSHGSP